tara:strand:+ start:1513 stop:2148 length:636 start_codon:yes stop_codon:yes gene_type:complete
MKNFRETDGRSIRQQNIFNKSHNKLVNSAIELLKNPNIENEKINVSLIAKYAGTSVATAYNHFPQNMVDVYGSIFALAFRNASEELALFIKTENNIEKQIQAFIETQSKQIVELGDAIRVAFFNINEIVKSGNWTQNEPFDFLLNLCNKYNKINKNIDSFKLTSDTIQAFNGALFLWMRFNPNYGVWSQFDDEWFLKQANASFKNALLLQN